MRYGDATPALRYTRCLRQASLCQAALSGPRVALCRRSGSSISYGAYYEPGRDYRDSFDAYLLLSSLFLFA